VSRARVPELIARLQTRAAARQALAAARAALPAEPAPPVPVVEADPCEACGCVDPDASCWLCGPVWLAELRQRFEEDQAAAAREARMAAEESRALLAQERAEIAAAEARVAWLTDWTQKLTRAVSEYEQGRGYVVELVAEALYGAGVGRETRRGRPSALAAVALVMAADRDPRTGGTTLPGRDVVAEIAGCSPRAVTSAWQGLERQGWLRRVRRGGLVSLDRRASTGRVMDRAEFRVRLLVAEDCAHHGPHMPAAAALAAALLARTADLLARAQAELDGLRRRYGGRRTPAPADVVRRVRLRHAVRAALTGPNVSRNFCTSSGGTSVSTEGSGLVLTLGSSSPVKSDHPDNSGHRPIGREGLAGASPTSRGRDDLEVWGCRPAQRPQRPRALSAPRRRPRRRPAWMDWALPLAYQLRAMWDHLNGVPVVRIAATLGGHLAPTGPDGDPWTAERLADLAESGRDGLPVMPEPRYRLAYLRSLLDGLPERYRRARSGKSAGQAPQGRAAREHQDHAAAPAGPVVGSDSRPRTLARRLALYLARPVTVSPGTCLAGCTGPDVAPRPYGRRHVPLCGPCAAVLDTADQD
jgi:hypothetical protein